MAFAGVQAPAPTRRHLRHWEQVCCFLDSRPRRAVAHPFPMGLAVPLLSTRLLKRMAACKLVSHYDDCTWRLNRRWRSRLTRLADGLPADEPKERRQRGIDGGADPFIADVVVDTLYISLYGEEVPTALLEACDYYKDLAQEDDATIETEWLYFDAPLSMYKHGWGQARGTVSVGRFSSARIPAAPPAAHTPARHVWLGALLCSVSLDVRPTRHA